MKTNTTKRGPHTYEGAPARHITPLQELRRSVCSCLLWENEFYEDGQDIAGRIAGLTQHVSPEDAAALAIEARTTMKLRHVPLLLAVSLAARKPGGSLVRQTVRQIIQRPDEATELLSLYWKDGRRKLPKQLKRGIADALVKFNAYQLAKYKQDDKAIKLRDAVLYCEPRYQNEEQRLVFESLINRTIAVPDTWETALSSGSDKRSTWLRLIAESKLGALALLRNLRNMEQAGVDRDAVRTALTTMKVDRVLPFRFIAAARHAPWLEPELESAMFRCVADRPKLPGNTTLLIDVSGSMGAVVSAKSEVTRLDAACGVAMLARELCNSVDVYSFSNSTVCVPARRGFALRDAIVGSQEHGGTNLGSAVSMLSARNPHRLIVVTDEQSHDAVSWPLSRNYVINVASARNGVGYGRTVVHLDGFSEAVLDWMTEYEGRD